MTTVGQQIIHRCYLKAGLDACLRLIQQLQSICSLKEKRKPGIELPILEGGYLFKVFLVVFIFSGNKGTCKGVGAVDPLNV